MRISMNESGCKDLISEGLEKFLINIANVDFHRIKRLHVADFASVVDKLRGEHARSR